MFKEKVSKMSIVDVGSMKNSHQDNWAVICSKVYKGLERLVCAMHAKKSWWIATFHLMINGKMSWYILIALSLKISLGGFCNYGEWWVTNIDGAKKAMTPSNDSVVPCQTIKFKVFLGEVAILSILKINKRKFVTSVLFWKPGGGNSRKNLKDSRKIRLSQIHTRFVLDATNANDANHY